MNNIDKQKAISKQLQQIYQPQLAEQYSWWLLEKLTDKTKVDLILQKDLELSSEQTQLLEQWLNQMVNEHKPIAYVLGDVPFGELMIQVEPPVLIPRPETEQWTLNLIEQIKKSDITDLRILDMCTGSGCIALLLAHELPDATIYAVDIAHEAVTLAQKNKQLLNITNIHIITSDVFEKLTNMTFDIIVTNPPYIASTERLDLSVIQWEDKQALFADDNGLAFIKKMINEAPKYIQPNRALQRNDIKQLYIEIGWQQGQAVKKLMQKNEYTAITIKKDRAQKDRVVCGRIRNVATAADKR